MADVIPAEEAFIVTVGVRRNSRDFDCMRALTVLQRAGFQCGPTSDAALIQLGAQAQDQTNETEDEQ